MKVKGIACALVMALSASIAGAENMSQDDIAKEYFTGLYAGDRDAVRALAAPDLAFQDPSAPAAYGVPVLVELEAVLDLFAGFAGALVEFTNVYASNDQVVVAVEISGTLPAAAFGLEGGDVSFASNRTTILQIKEGLVISHTDYMNYPRFEQSITPVE